MRPGRASAARAHLPEANETQRTSATSAHYNEAEQRMMARIELTFVSDFAFSPNGKILAVVGRDHASVLLLDLAPAQSGELFDRLRRP